ncbi:MULTISPECIES: mechanosensitive ion channel family protein [unclassified Microbacterium]|uniref:mechanosensitive ion channel family protein n=1 Tax=unclassified Microbacterium TaxID=2609290 RepID=UPI0037458147
MLDPWLQFGITLVVAVVAAIVVTAVVAFAVRVLARRREWPHGLVRHGRRPFRVLVLLVALWIAVSIALPVEDDPAWSDPVDQLFTILIIAAAAWLLGAMVLFATDVTLGRHRIDVADNRVARRIRTQTLIVRRLAVVLIVIVAFASILMTFPAVQTFGASLLASAGIASVVAGLAAQSVLANVFAGVQLVFSDALRVDDVVVVEGEWGRIGEITLSYVVVDLWDDRRLVLPCTYFTTKPFENWTREGSELLGAVELDVDWRVSPARMREHLETVLAGTTLWDGRASVLQVTDAVGGFVRVRILVTAADAPTLFDLRCHVREAIVAWVQHSEPDALPVQRVMITQPDAETTVRPPMPADAGAGLFTGSAAAEERAAHFTQAIPVVGDGSRPRTGSIRAEEPGQNG